MMTHVNNYHNDILSIDILLRVKRHYQRYFSYIRPDHLYAYAFVFVLLNGINQSLKRTKTASKIELMAHGSLALVVTVWSTENSRVDRFLLTTVLQQTSLKTLSKTYGNAL